MITPAYLSPAFKQQTVDLIAGQLSRHVSTFLSPTPKNTVVRKSQRAGRDGGLLQSLAGAQDVLTFNPKEFIAQGEKVVALRDYSWRVKATGREFGSEWAHVWTVRNGRLVGFQEYADTAAVSKAHQKAAGA